MSAAPACDIHGRLPEGQRFCEHCMRPGQQGGSPGAVALSPCETESLRQFVAGDSTGLARTALPGFGFAARSIGDLEYNSGPVQPGERWTLRLRLPRLSGRAEVQVRVAGQRKTVNLLNGGEHVVQFDALIAGTHHLNFYVCTDTRKLEGDGAIEARVRGAQGDRPAVNINAEGGSHFIKVDMGSSEKPVDSWQLCALRDHPHAAVTLQPRKNSECVPNVVFLRPPAGELCRLIRGNRNIIGRGHQSHIDLHRWRQEVVRRACAPLRRDREDCERRRRCCIATRGSSANGVDDHELRTIDQELGRIDRQIEKIESVFSDLSREALELELRSSGCVHLAVRNRLGARINRKPLEKDQSQDIPLHAFESWQIIEFPGEISVRLKSIQSPSECGIVHSPWTDLGHIARREGVGGMHVRVEVFGDRFDLVWVLDAVSVRDVSARLPGAGIVFDQGESLYHIDTSVMLERAGPRSAFPLERGAEWELPSGRWRVPFSDDGEVHG